MSCETEVPTLRVISRTQGAAPDLLSLADAGEPLLWLRGGRGCVGAGEALRLVFRGSGRFEEAARAWQSVVAAAEIDDGVNLPGSGLVALGTFAFDDHSAAESVLIVPRTLIASDGETHWVTEVFSEESADNFAEMTEVHASGVLKDALLSSRRDGGEGSAGADWAGTGFSATEASLTAYIDGVREAVRRISARDVEKVVLARQISGGISTTADLRVPLGRLADRYTDCWTFAVDGLIGASPETLIRSTRGTVSARVLAGTRGRRAEDPARDARERDELLTSGKEQQEHAFAVQSVVTALAPHVRDLQASADPFALELPNVWHLATDLSAELVEAGSSLDLAGALHPTAAVAGTPTAAAVAAIAELEPFDRGRYAGAVGWIDASGDGEWAIALRCAQIGKTDAATGVRPIVASAGGGIVAGSDPEHELGETVSKFRPISEAFGA